MIKYVSENLFDSPAQTLVNTVNTVGIMGKGIALEFKKRYPAMFTRYKEFCASGALTVGTLYLYRTPGKWVLNFPTKQHWRNPSKLEFIEAGLKKFVDTYTDQGVTSVSFPQLGCGNGGLPWSAVQPLIETYLGKIAIPVYVHVAVPAKSFVPEHTKVARRGASLLGLEDIQFVDFVKDLLAVTKSDLTRLQDSPEAAEHSRVLLINLNQLQPITVSVDELEDLWQSLRGKGAIAPQDTSSTLRPHATELFQALIQLPYVKPITFVLGDRRVVGVKYAPADLRTSGAAQTADPVLS